MKTIFMTQSLPMIQLQRGDVVLCRVPVPLNQSSQFKLRPAVIITAVEQDNSCDDVMIVPCTSNTDTPLKDTHYLITGDEIELAGIEVEWVIRCESIFTLNKSMILKKLGSLSRRAMKQVDYCLMTALEL